MMFRLLYAVHLEELLVVRLDNRGPDIQEYLRKGCFRVEFGLILAQVLYFIINTFPQTAKKFKVIPIDVSMFGTIYL